VLVTALDALGQTLTPAGSMAWSILSVPVLGFFLSAVVQAASGAARSYDFWGMGVLSFVCSVGNVPLAVVLRKGGISFGGVVAFVFTDLIIPIYRRYDGWRLTWLLAAYLYVCAAIAGYVIGLLFEALGLVPDPSTATLPDGGVSWDHTTWLDTATLVLAVLLVVRFVRSGGTAMLRRMGDNPEPSETGGAG